MPIRSLNQSSMTDSSSHRENASESSLQDDVLVKRAAAGDQKAFREITEKYQKPLYYHVLRMVKETEQVEDLVQEAFMKAFHSLNRYNTQYAFSTWLYRIATNHTIDYLRKKKLNTVSVNNPIKTKDGEVEVEIPDTTYETDRNILASQRKQIIHSAIDNLPDKYRKVIEMRHLEELSYDEIAEQLDLPLGTVKAHIFRAREMLYKELKDKREQF
ncbi:MAG: sigma-70 family RNA polymerase sigma factor [Balneolaceae bacterium]